MKNPGLGLRNSERVGAANPNSKLQDKDVRMLREYRKGGWSHADLSLLFGISESRSSELCRGKGYPDAGGPIETKKSLYCSAVVTRREKLTPAIAEVIKRLYNERPEGRRPSHAAIQKRVLDEFDVEISKSLVGLVLRGRTKY